MSETAPNLPEYTVSEISLAVKRTVEDAFPYVRVRGEVSGYRGPHSSGHAYFSLKDDKARIDAVIWRSAFNRLRFKPEEGLEVLVTGRISTFPGSSKYQLVIEALEPAGTGALMALLEERKKKLAAEGLFDSARKRPLPYLPRVVGVVTSPTGAVIRDILHRLSDRFPVHVLVWPVRVQGETSANEVAAGIRGFNAIPAGGPVPRPDVIIVARGGGSLEDLWGFNEEVVVRAAAASEIPLVSAVGHETDWTLIDLAADVRAPTPTGAAEMVVPVRSELMATVDGCARRLASVVRRCLEAWRTELRSASRGLPAAEMLLALPRQRLDRAGDRLAGGLRGALHTGRQRYLQTAARLAPAVLGTMTERARTRLQTAEERRARALQVSIERHRAAFEACARHIRRQVVDERIARAKDRLAAVWRLVDSLSHRSVLARGFALVATADGTLLRSAEGVAPGTALDITFADGHLPAVAGEGGERPRSAPARAKREPGPGQGSLFDD